LKFYITEKSIIGTREEQQDSYYSAITESTVFAVVCDGMGGVAGGGAASRTAVNRMRQFFESENVDKSVPAFFLRAIDILDESVVGLQKEFAEMRSAGTTIVAVIIRGDALYWLSVGDSRLYILRDNEIVQVTRDHNYALTLEQLTETERKETLCRSGQYRADALISFIGMGGVKIFDINEDAFRLRSGDQVLLTTDGLTKMLTDQEILSALQNEAPMDALETLFRTAAAKTTGARDNTTCVLIQIRD
jgi:protein phosphatase